jgi:hypothetical protein
VFEVMGNGMALLFENESVLVGTSPMLVTTHVKVVLELPTVTSLNARVVTIVEIVAGFCTVAERARVGEEPGMAEAVSVADFRPLPLAAVALNRMGVVQDAPPARGWPSWQAVAPLPTSHCAAFVPESERLSGPDACWPVLVTVKLMVRVSLRSTLPYAALEPMAAASVRAAALMAVPVTGAVAIEPGEAEAVTFAECPPAAVGT